MNVNAVSMIRVALSSLPFPLSIAAIGAAPDEMSDENALMKLISGKTTPTPERASVPSSGM